MEQLLVLREDELKREYEDLVRSRDAAYESLNSINRALADNRAESRRVFQERLLLASSSPSSSSSTTAPAAPTRPTTRSTARASATSASSTNPTAAPRRSLSSMCRRVRFAAENPSPVYPLKFTSFYSQVPVHHYNIWKRIRNANTTENAGRIPMTPSDALKLALHRLRNPGVRSSTQGNVGNEHSYAVNNEESEANAADEEDNATRDAAASALLSGAATAADAASPGTSGWGRPLIPIDDSSIDLSIVKTEPAEEVDTEASTQNNETKPRISSGIKEPSAERETALQRSCSSRRCSHSHNNDHQERLNKRREQTRQRMRRWRERRRLGLLGSPTSKIKFKEPKN